MNRSDDRYDFESFPRGELSIPISRREALLAPVTESRAREAQGRGDNVFKLSALGNMPDELLELLTPRLTAGPLVERDGFITAASRGVMLFPADVPAVSVCRRFDGHTMLASVALEIAREQEWEAPRAFAYVRGVFLHLITLGVCLPK